MPKDERPYITVHHGMPEHPKVEALSDKAFRTLVGCWCWCSKNRSDGKISRKSWLKRGTPRARKELIDNGLAVLTEDGVEMHDYLQHQRSRAEIEAHVENKIEAGRKGGAVGNHRRWHIALGKFDPHCKLCVDLSAEPSAAADEDDQQNHRQTISSSRSNGSADASAKPSAKHHSATTTDTEQLQEQLLAATSSQREQPAARKPDPLFDALVAACGINPNELTKPQRGSINGALKELRDIGASPEQVTTRAKRYPEYFPNATLTPPALAKHWGQLGRPKPSKQTADDFRGF